MPDLLSNLSILLSLYTYFWYEFKLFWKVAMCCQLSSVDKLLENCENIFGHCWLMDSQFMGHDHPTTLGSRTTHRSNTFLFGQVPPTKIHHFTVRWPYQLSFPPKSFWVGWLLPPWPSLDHEIFSDRSGSWLKRGQKAQDLVGGHSFLQIFWVFYCSPVKAPINIYIAPIYYMVDKCK